MSCWKGLFRPKRQVSTANIGVTARSASRSQDGVTLSSTISPQTDTSTLSITDYDYASSAVDARPYRAEGYGMNHIEVDNTARNRRNGYSSFSGGLASADVSSHKEQSRTRYSGGHEVNQITHSRNIQTQTDVARQRVDPSDLRREGRVEPQRQDMVISRYDRRANLYGQDSDLEMDESFAGQYMRVSPVIPSERRTEHNKDIENLTDDGNRRQNWDNIYRQSKNRHNKAAKTGYPSEINDGRTEMHTLGNIYKDRTSENRTQIPYTNNMYPNMSNEGRSLMPSQDKRWHAGTTDSRSENYSQNVRYKTELGERSPEHSRMQRKAEGSTQMYEQYSMSHNQKVLDSSELYHSQLGLNIHEKKNEELDRFMERKHHAKERKNRSNQRKMDLSNSDIPYIILPEAYTPHNSPISNHESSKYDPVKHWSRHSHHLKQYVGKESSPQYHYRNYRSRERPFSESGNQKEHIENIPDREQAAHIIYVPQPGNLASVSDESVFVNQSTVDKTCANCQNAHTKNKQQYTPKHYKPWYEKVSRKLSKAIFGPGSGSRVGQLSGVGRSRPHTHIKTAGRYSQQGFYLNHVNADVPSAYPSKLKSKSLDLSVQKGYDEDADMILKVPQTPPGAKPWK